MSGRGLRLVVRNSPAIWSHVALIQIHTTTGVAIAQAQYLYDSVGLVVRDATSLAFSTQTQISHPQCVSSFAKYAAQGKDCGTSSCDGSPIYDLADTSFRGLQGIR